jgi:hypothetical protein
MGERYKLYLRTLHTRHAIFNYFGSFGRIAALDVAFCPETRKCLGWGFLRYEEPVAHEKRLLGPDHVVCREPVRVTALSTTDRNRQFDDRGFHGFYEASSTTAAHSDARGLTIVSRQHLVDKTRKGPEKAHVSLRNVTSTKEEVGRLASAKPSAKPNVLKTSQGTGLPNVLSAFSGPEPTFLKYKTNGERVGIPKAVSFRCKVRCKASCLTQHPLVSLLVN